MNRVQMELTIDPLVTLVCLDDGCIHNLAKHHSYAYPAMYCNLKNVTIQYGGKCAFFQAKPKERQRGKACPKCQHIIDDADYWNTATGCCLRCALEAKT